jgi:phosphatidylserine decarboxylase
MKKNFLTAIQLLIPLRLLSWCVYKLSRVTIPFVKNIFIELFIKKYNIDLSEYRKGKKEDYLSFNDFFTREIKPEFRLIESSYKTMVSPVDGTLIELGEINEDRIIQIKDSHYSLTKLLNNNQALAIKYLNGYFVTLYLAPENYHRVHMPLDGTLVNSELVPGKCFAVNQESIEKIPDLYIKNQRLINAFENQLSPFILILVAALNVSSITTVWKSEDLQAEEPLTLPKGEQMGQFNLGSTVILLVPKESQLIWSETIEIGTRVKVGQVIAQINND